MTRLRLKRLTLAALLALAAGFAIGCAHTPPNLGPAGQLAWKQNEVQKDLDLLRDIAQDGSAQTPPVVSVAAARAVTTWHRSAIVTIHEAKNGWEAVVETGATQTRDSLPAADKAKLGKYFDLALAALKGVTQ